MHTLRGMTIKADRDEVLKALVENREKHLAIVVEARKGYVEKARAALSKRLDDLASGKIVGLSFNLVAPQNYTKVYDTAIKMLQMHQERTIELDSGQVRNLMMDEWDWTDVFYGSNASYSATAAKELAAKGGE